MAITASEARRNLFPLIDQVNDDQEPVEIVSRRGSAFLVSESQYRSLMETAYLLRSPANASRLLESIAALEGGQGTQHDLVDVDAEEPDAALKTELAGGAPPPGRPAKKTTKRTSHDKVTVAPTTADTPTARTAARGTAKGAGASAAKASKPSRG